MKSFKKYLYNLLLFLLLVFSLSNAKTMQLADPSIEQISTDWSQISNGQDGRLVYSKDSVIIIWDLNEQAKTPIRKMKQFSWATSYSWSPDGSRILVQNPWKLMVMQADGSNAKNIYVPKFEFLGELLSSDWADTFSVVYSTNDKIKRSYIDEKNNVIKTVTILDKPPFEAYNYTTLSGDFIAYIDIRANILTGGYHRPVIYNFITDVTTELVPRSGDGCGIKLRPDGSGIAVYHNNNHMDPALIVNNSGVVIDSIPIVPNFPTVALNWSNDTDYVVHNGDFSDSGYAWIRKLSTDKALYLGMDIYRPDLWVGDKPVAVRSSVPFILPDYTNFTDSIEISLECTTIGANIYYTTDGTTPNINSKIYKTPFFINEPVTIKAISVKYGLNESFEAEKHFAKGSFIRAENPVSLSKGLNCSYFNGSWYKIPEFEKLLPIKTTISSNFNLDTSEYKEYFGAVFEGYILLERNDIYKFYLSSDDGSMLYIGDSVVISNDGWHDLQTRSTSIALEAGFHPIKLYYFNFNAISELSLSYESSLDQRQQIPDSLLFCTSVKKINVEIFNSTKSFFGGDTINISWLYQNGIGRGVVVELSVDSGITYNSIFQQMYVHKKELADTFAIIKNEWKSNKCFIRIRDYDNPNIYAISSIFSIKPSDDIVTGKQLRHLRIKTVYLNNKIYIRGAKGKYQIKLYKLNGKEVKIKRLSPNVNVWAFYKKSSGVYLLSVTNNKNYRKNSYIRILR